MQPREIIANSIESDDFDWCSDMADKIIEALGAKGFEIVSRGWIDSGYQPPTFVVHRGGEQVVM